MKLFYTILVAIILSLPLNVLAQEISNKLPNDAIKTQEIPKLNKHYSAMKKADKPLESNTFYYTGFESGALPSDMTTYDVDKQTHQLSQYGWAIDKPWVVLSYFGDGTMATSCSYYTTNEPADKWLVTPKVTITDGALLDWDALSVPYLSGVYRGLESYEVLISTTGNSIEDFTEVIFSIDEAPNEETHYSIDLDALGYKDQDIYVAFRHTSTNKLILALDNIKIHRPHQNDVAVFFYNPPSYADLNESTTLPIVIVNYGSETLNSIDITYTDNEIENVTTSLTDLDLPYNYYVIKDVPVPYSPESVGLKTVSLTLSNPNATDDGDEADNATECSVFVYDNQNTVKRTPCNEMFTSATCGPCYNGNINLTNGLNNVPDGNYTVIKYQMSWPGNGDIYYTEEGGTRRTVYGINSVPALILDGQSASVSDYSTAYNISAVVPSFVTITGTYSIDERTIYVDASITPSNDMPPGTYTAHIVVIENKTTGNVATNGETEFYNVMHKMLPNANGTAVTLTKDQEVTLSESYRFPEDANVEEMDDLSVVLLVQNNSTLEVMNSAYAIEASAVEEGTDSDGSGIAGMFPNPATENIYVRFVTNGQNNVNIDIYDISGNKLSSNNFGSVSDGIHTEALSVSNLTSGTYIMKLSIGDKTFARQFIVNK